MHVPNTIPAYIMISSMGLLECVSAPDTHRQQMLLVFMVLQQDSLLSAAGSIYVSMYLPN